MAVGVCINLVCALKHFIEEIQNYSTIGFQSQDFVKRALTAALGEDKAANLIDQILMGSGAKGL